MLAEFVRWSPCGPRAAARRRAARTTLADSEKRCVWESWARRYRKVRETFPTVSDDPRSMRLPMRWERALRRSAGCCATGAPRAKAALRSRFVWVPSRKGVW